jgi:Na+-driven multidrug efflux pump
LQKYGAIFTLIAYFVLGIPISWYTSFKAGWGIKGLWCGPAVAASFNFFVYVLIFKKTDW